MQSSGGISRWTKNRRLNSRVNELLGITKEEPENLSFEDEVLFYSVPTVEDSECVEESSTSTSDQCANVIVLHIAQLTNKMQSMTDCMKVMGDNIKKLMESNCELKQDLKDCIGRMEQSCALTKEASKNIAFPVSSVERLLQLDKDMRNNDQSNELIRSRLQTCKCDSFKETIRSAMSMLIDRKCAVDVSLSGNRKLFSFKSTLLYSHLRDIALDVKTDDKATAKNFDKQLIEWFHGVRDRISVRKRPRLSKLPTLTKNSYFANTGSSEEDKENEEPSCSSRT